MRYFDGVPVISGTDLNASGFGADWGVSRSFNTPLATGGTAAGPHGKGWVVAERPYLIDNGGGTIIAVDSAGTQRWFDLSGGTYTARFSVLDKLTTAAGEFVLTDTAGNVTRYYDFDAGLPALQRGTFKSHTDAAGNVTSVHSFDASGRATDVRRSGGGVTESMQYAYVASGPNAGLVENVTLRRSTDGGSTWSTVRSVAYSYYDGTLAGAHAFGRANYLRTATVRDAVGATIETMMYRYYTDDSATGQTGALRFAVGGDSYARLAAAVADPLLATDAQVAAYADNYFEYDGYGRVAKEIAQGAGCSTCTGGYGSFTFEYAANPAATGGAGYDEYNAWEHRTAETLPDGNQYVVYANKHGQVMLKVFQELGASQSPASITRSTTTATVTLNGHGFANGDRVAVGGAGQAAYNGTYEVADVTANTFTYTMLSDPGATASGAVTVKKVTRQWRTFYKYDGAGRVVLAAGPSAVTGYNEGSFDLLAADPVTGSYAHLSDAAGMVELFEYGSGTTASTSAAGDVLGYPKAEKIKRGEAGTAITQHEQSYIAQTAGGVTVYLVNGETVYRNADGTGAQTTTHAYTFVTNTTHVESVTTTLPTITTAQNGPNAAAGITTVFDAYGNPTWTRDADGFITALEYDVATGAPAKSIADVNTATSTNEPSGWVTPAGGGLHLTTTMGVDALGRATRLTDPNGNVTHTVFKDAEHEVRVYPGWQSGTGTTTGPVEVVRDDRGRKYTESLTMAPATISTSGGAPTGAEAVGNVQSLSRSVVNDAGQLIASDRYVDLTGYSYSAANVTIGVAGTNYYRTELAYDQRGRVKREKNAVGTITWTLYDGRGNPTSIWVGTDDTGAMNGDPDGAGSPNNMRKVSESEYDNGTAGDGNLTKLTLIPGGSAANRVTRMYYDWRNRLVATKEGDEGGGAGENGDANRQLVYCELDNLGQRTACEWYDADGVVVTSTSGVPDKPSASLRRARAETSFDEQGNVYRTRTVSVDQNTGTAGDALQSDAWRDKRGNVVKSKDASGLVTKHQYDGAMRVTKSFATDGGGDAAWADADDVTGDKVLEQTQYTYDANGNVTLVTGKQRFHDETGTGELGNATTSPKARVSYAASYYDAADRVTADVNVGTNGGGAYARPGTVPARSDSVLVDSYGYDAAGRPWKATGPKGIEDRSEYDLLGRVTKTTEAYADGTPGDADDRVTRYTYDGLDHVRTLTADLPAGQADQTTEYVYGVSPASNSDVHTFDLLAEVRYPDKSTGAAGTANGDKDRYAYNALGQVTKLTDRNGSTHEYAHDVTGRTLSDSVTVLAAGVDGAVRRLETAYDTAGRPSRFTSHSAAAGNSVVNQVQQAFNGLGQVTAEYQEHAGAVDTGTSAKVQYAYDATASGGVLTRGSRATGMTYPNGRVLRYDYTAGLDDAVSRVSHLADDDAGATGTRLEAYGYLGAGTIVRRLRPQTGVDLTYAKLAAEPAGDAGDPYTGLDRFGRVADQRWFDDNDTGNTTADDVHADRFVYTYDRNSNRMSRDVTATGAPTTHDEAYTYDNLDRLSKMNRGALAAGTITDANATYTKRWDGVGGSGGLDALGNWKGVSTDADGGGAGAAATQTRTHNARNELTGVGASTLAFDANGSMTTDETGRQFVYDAWNRTARAKTAAGADLITFKLDALNRRIVEAPAGGVQRDLYHSLGWQVIEEREGGTAKYQNVWSLAYVDALVLRDTLDAAAGTLDPSFSGDGKAVVNAPPGTLGDEFRTVIQSDGKVVAAGYVGGDVAVVRFNPDGSLDTSFDGDGIAVTDFGGDNDRALDVTVQPDGKIVVAGSSRGVNSRGDAIVGRYNVNGSLDTSFDGDGKVKRDFGPGDQVFAVEVDGSGKLVLAGMTNDNAPLADLLVVRLNANGSLDNSFDADGSRIIDLGDKTVAQGMALDRQGRIVLAGSKTVGTDKKGLVIRLTSGGAYDTSFSGDGVVEEEFGGADEFNHVAADDRGRIVAAGNGGTNGATATSGQDAIVARYTDAGALDTSFGASGKRYVHLGGSSDDAEDMALDPFGRVVLVGDDGGVDFAVARLTADGNLDTTFDADGLVKIDFGATSGEDGQAVAIQTDGRIVVVGRKGSDFAVARLSGGGTRTYALQDANFNTTAVTDATGKVLDRYQYDAYGAVKVLNADWSVDADGVQDVNVPFLWQGGALVTATGTYHFRRRDVSPMLGRATSADPLGYPDGMSRYQWELSNPVGRLDPSGLRPPDMPYAGNGPFGPLLNGPTVPLERDRGNPLAPKSPAPAPVAPPPPVLGGPTTAPAAVYMPALRELAWLGLWAKQRNEDQGIWWINFQCEEQADDIANHLETFAPKWWKPKVIGGKDVIQHHVVVLIPQRGNPLEPYVIDGFHGIFWTDYFWTGCPPNYTRDVQVYPLADFYKMYPKPQHGYDYQTPDWALPNQVFPPAAQVPPAVSAPAPPKPNTDPWPYNPSAPSPIGK